MACMACMACNAAAWRPRPRSAQRKQKLWLLAPRPEPAAPPRVANHQAQQRPSDEEGHKVSWTARLLPGLLSGRVDGLLEYRRARGLRVLPGGATWGSLPQERLADKIEDRRRVAHLAGSALNDVQRRMMASGDSVNSVGHGHQIEVLVHCAEGSCHHACVRPDASVHDQVHAEASELRGQVFLPRGHRPARLREAVHAPLELHSAALLLGRGRNLRQYLPPVVLVQEVPVLALHDSQRPEQAVELVGVVTRPGPRLAHAPQELWAEAPPAAPENGQSCRAEGAHKGSDLRADSPQEGFVLHYKLLNEQGRLLVPRQIPECLELLQVLHVRHRYVDCGRLVPAATAQIRRRPCFGGSHEVGPEKSGGGGPRHPSASSHHDERPRWQPCRP
mmetsp:Transcript_104597/g.332698  ORF Transcript_104597/g.332698 Transcript_104597/m.332698 type:complete len:390 (+) Transcript_104597:31-1200(+)